MALLTTTVRAKRHAALAGAENTHLTNLLTSASNMVEAYCHRVFTSTAYAPEYQDGLGGDWLFVKNPPITAFTSIAVEDAYGDTETILAAEFVRDNDTGRIQFKVDADSDFAYFPVGIQNIDITYTGGYAAIPDEVQDAVILIAMNLYSLGSKANPGLKSERLGEYSYTRMDATAMDPMTPAVKGLLGEYRIFGGDY